MSIEITNKRINKRSKEIRNFIKYLNSEFYIPHKVKLEIIDYPCIFFNKNYVCFGLFYSYYNNFKIKIVNDLEFYRLGNKKSIYFTLQTISHEIYHYFQFLNSKNVIENWVDHNAHKIVFNYVKNNSNKTKLTLNFINKKNILNIDMKPICPGINYKNAKNKKQK